MKRKLVFLPMLLCQMSGKVTPPAGEGGIPQKGTVFWNNDNTVKVIFLQVWTHDQKNMFLWGANTICGNQTFEVFGTQLEHVFLSAVYTLTTINNIIG